MKFPVGIQDFRTLREGGYVYVDKTEHIHRLVESGKYYFLSRPRRFGKSLLLATLNELYRGRRELFAGLWIEERWDWEARRRPVVWLKFAKMDYQGLGLAGALDAVMDGLGRAHEVTYPKGLSFKEKFVELIQRLSQRDGRVVLLVDEYDKPSIDYIDDVEKTEEHRYVLKRLYSVLKDSDPYLELVMLTGVSAFTRVSIFSDFNNLSNITLDPLAYTLVGITEDELDKQLASALAEVDRAKLRRWYNGYSFGGEERVYNPFSLLSFLRSKTYQNFWFETGTPTFLINLLRRNKLYDLSNLRASGSTLRTFDTERLDPLSVLFQTGYLTIVGERAEGLIYMLDYPNLEVRQSLEQILLRDYLGNDDTDALPRILDLQDALEDGNLDRVREIIDSAFLEIAYDHWQNQGEHFFHALTFLMFRLLGVFIQTEVHSARGRCDAVVFTRETICAFEFKLDRPAEEALAQIEERGCLEPYRDDPRRKVAVGVSFSSERRAVGEMAVA